MGGAVLFVAVGGAIGGAAALLVVLPFLLRGRRASVAPDATRLAATVHAYRHLTPAQRTRLQEQVRRFLRHKRVSQADRPASAIMQVAAAGNACLLQLFAGADGFPTLREVALEPGNDTPRRVHADAGALQDAMAGGPANPVVRAFAGLLAEQRAGAGAAHADRWWRAFEAACRDDADAASPREALPRLSEAFFQRPGEMEKMRPQLFCLLQEYYGLTPGA